MQSKSVLAAAGLAAALGLASQTPAEACCRRGEPVMPVPAVTHFVYYPQYYNIYYTMSFAPDPYPVVYMPRGYWNRYERPYARYGRRYWAPRWARGPVVPVPAPTPVPVDCCEDVIK